MGTVIYKLVAQDLDVNSSEALNFAVTDPITATDKNGKEVKSDVTFKVSVGIIELNMFTIKKIDIEILHKVLFVFIILIRSSIRLKDGGL